MIGTEVVPFSLRLLTHASFTVNSSGEGHCVNNLRRSPSVKTPRNTPLESTMHAKPKPLPFISTRSWGTVSSSEITGNSLPSLNRSSHRTSNRRPRAPSGWNLANCSSVNPRESRRLIASASATASCNTALVVGARERGPASLISGIKTTTSLNFATGESKDSHTEMMDAPSRLKCLRNLTNSSV